MVPILQHFCLPCNRSHKVSLCKREMGDEMVSNTRREAVHLEVQDDGNTMVHEAKPNLNASEW